MVSIKTNFGANVRHYRKKQGLTQEQLAEKLGITTKHLSTIETGANFVSADLLERLALQFGVSASAFFYSVEEVSIDDSIFNKIDKVIEDECQKLTSELKAKIRYLNDV